MMSSSGSLSDFFHYDFLGRALLAGLLMSFTCGLLSPVVVLRRLSFAADGLAHASLGGLALGMFLLASGPVPTLASYVVSFVFTCLIALVIAWIASGNRMHSDTAVGACYVAAFALGILLLSTSQQSAGHLEHVFFGSLLAASRLECQLLAGLAVITTALMFMSWRWLGSWTFDEDLARATGVPVASLRYVLILLIAATVILATRVVGILLVTAMLIIPGAVGTLLGQRMLSIVAISLALALSSSTTGLLWSNAAGVPPGPAMVLASFACFIAAFLTRHHRDRRRSPIAPHKRPD